MRREAGGPRDGMGFACVLFSLKRLHDEISLCPMSAKGKRQRQKAKGKRQKKKKKKKKKDCAVNTWEAQNATHRHTQRDTHRHRGRETHTEAQASRETHER